MMKVIQRFHDFKFRGTSDYPEYLKKYFSSIVYESKYNRKSDIELFKDKICEAYNSVFKQNKVSLEIIFNEDWDKGQSYALTRKFESFINEQIEEDNFSLNIDMSIIINSIPGKIGNPQTHSFNRKFLNLGMILIIALHEVFGHFMRRYYSLLTGRQISFNTPDDTDNLTGDESGFFIELKFIGLKGRKSNIGLNKCLVLLNNDNFDNYPIFKKDNFTINYTILKKIYDDNEVLFNFIIDDKYNKENNEDENSTIDRTITLDDYLDTLINVNNISY